MSIAERVDIPWWRREIATNSTGRVIKTLTYSILIGLLVIGFIVFVPMLWGWYPVLGHSMEPTFPWVGGFYKIDMNPDAQPETGKLVIFRTPNDNVRCVKRIGEVREDASLWVQADNKDWTGEDSDNFGWVPSENVIGFVGDIWSPKRMLQALTPGGRVKNHVEFSYHPQDILWSLDSRYVVIKMKGEIKVYVHNNGELSLICQDKFWEDKRRACSVKWQDGKLAYLVERHRPMVWLVFDPKTTKTHEYNTMDNLLNNVIVNSIQGAILKPGAIAQIEAGSSIVIEGTKTSPREAVYFVLIDDKKEQFGFNASMSQIETRNCKTIKNVGKWPIHIFPAPNT